MKNKILVLSLGLITALALSAAPIEKFDTITTNSPTKAKVEFIKGIKVNSTDSLIVPVGTTAQRDSVPANGMVRANTTTSNYEGYLSGVWNKFLTFTTGLSIPVQTDLNSNKIVNLLDPTSAQDAATKKYVDDTIGTVDFTNLVDRTTNQTVGGIKTFSSPIVGSVTGNAATVTTNANLTGEVTSIGNAATVPNATVIGKVLTGFVSTPGTVAATDSILQAVQKLDGNSSNTSILGQTLTGYSAAPGTVSSSDTIKTAIQKVDGNSSNASTIGRTLTGYTAGAGTVSSSDSILTAIQKVDGNSSNASVIGRTLTGFTSGAGTVSSSDTVLSSIQKVDGNTNLKQDRTIITAKGDIYVGTASSTTAKQTIGTNAQVLTADSTQTNGLKWSDASILSKSATDGSSVTTTEIQTSNSQLTDVATGKRRLETNSTNLLADESFEDPTQSKWSCSLGTKSQDSSNHTDGANSLKIVSAGAGVRCVQSVTTNAASIKNLQMMARLAVNTTDTAGQVCALVDGTDTSCVYVQPTTAARPFQSIEIPFLAGGTSNGIVYKSTTTTVQNTYLDEAFAGRQKLTADLTNKSETFTLSTGVPITGATTNPTKATTKDIDSYKYYFIGDRIYVSFSYQHTASAGTSVGSGAYQIGLPPGITIDFTKTQVGAVGSVEGTSTATGMFTGSIATTGLTTSVQMYLTGNAIGSSYAPMNQVVVRYSGSFDLPVNGSPKPASTAYATSNADYGPVPATYTLTNAGNATITGTVQKVGSNAIYKGRISIGSTLPNATGMIVNLPSGYSFETSSTFANSSVSAYSGTNVVGTAYKASTTSFTFYGPNTSLQWNNTVPGTWAAGYYIDFTVTEKAPNWDNVGGLIIGQFEGHNMTTESFSGNGSTTAFTLAKAPSTINNTQVYINGVYQQKSTYSISGTTLTFSEAPPTGTLNIEVNQALINAAAVPSDGSVTRTKLDASFMNGIYTSPGIAQNMIRKQGIITCANTGSVIGSQGFGTSWLSSIGNMSSGSCAITIPSTTFPTSFLCSLTDRSGFTTASTLKWKVSEVNTTTIQVTCYKNDIACTGSVGDSLNIFCEGY